MSFKIDSSNNFGKELRKAAARQLKKSKKLLNGDANRQGDEDAAIHAFRKHIKKVRALLRMVGRELDKKTFERDSNALKEVARPLSRLRDATALIDTLNLLHDDSSKGNSWDGDFEDLRNVLRLNRIRIRRRLLEKDDVLRVAAGRVNKIHSRVVAWDFRHNLKRAVRCALRKTYKRSRNAMQAALTNGSDEHLHEYRKRAKDLQYQLELLQSMTPRMFGIVRGQIHRLTTLLGNDHDLAVLRSFTRGAIRQLIDRRRRRIQGSVLSLGEKLYAETPAQFSERLRAIHWPV